jgi:hypothetical protein
MTGCAGSEVPEPAYATSALEPAPVCEVVTPYPDGVPGTITQLASSGDTALIALYADPRLVSFVNGALVESWRLALSDDGYTGVHSPAGAALEGDSILYVSDARRRLIRRLSLSGEERGTVEVDFPPRELAVWGGGLIALRYLQPGNVDGLITLLREDHSTHVGPPPHPFSNPRLRGLANTMALSISRSGEILISHRTVVPRLYRVDPATGEFTQHTVVVPREVRGAFRPVPRLSRGPRDLEEILIPAFAVVEEPRSGDLLYVTGTGRWLGGSPEWALIRVSSEMEFRGAWALPFTVEALAALPRSGLLIAVDEEGEWRACPLDVQ